MRILSSNSLRVSVTAGRLEAILVSGGACDVVIVGISTGGGGGGGGGMTVLVGGGGGGTGYNTQIKIIYKFSTLQRCI